MSGVTKVETKKGSWRLKKNTEQDDDEVVRQVVWVLRVPYTDGEINTLG